MSYQETGPQPPDMLTQEGQAWLDQHISTSADALSPLVYFCLADQHHETEPAIAGIIRLSLKARALAQIRQFNALAAHFPGTDNDLAVFNQTAAFDLAEMLGLDLEACGQEACLYHAHPVHIYQYARQSGITHPDQMQAIIHQATLVDLSGGPQTRQSLVEAIKFTGSIRAWNTNLTSPIRPVKAPRLV